MANEITGREFVCGLKKATAWGTAVPCGAGDGLLLLSDGIKPKIAMIDDESAGQQWVTDTDPGEMSCAGSIEMYGRYVGFDLLLALLMGTASVSRIATTAAYKHTLDMASGIYGIFATLAEKKLLDKIWEYPGVKVHGVKITGETNKPLKASFDLTCDQFKRDSLINTTLTMAGVTAAKGNRIMMQNNAVFRLNNRSGMALAAGDQIKPVSFELSITRPMDTDAVAGQSGVAEPDDNGFPDVKLTLKFPRYNTANDLFFDDWAAGTPKKMDITFTGRDIEGGNLYTFKVMLPHLRVDNPEAAVSGPGKIPFSMTLNGYGADIAPAGMTGLVAPARIEMINTRTTALLA
jgi:hypothetical protein